MHMASGTCMGETKLLAGVDGSIEKVQYYTIGIFVIVQVILVHTVS